MTSRSFRVSGTIHPLQFWPAGESDADTIKVVVSPSDLAGPLGALSAVGRGRKPAVDARGRVTVRLEGIDAPELHYRPLASSAVTGDARAAFRSAARAFRQPLGEESARALGELLMAAAGSAPVECVVESAATRPKDAFDIYGRFVGTVVLRRADGDLDVNEWLLANGWAFPAFYDSMPAERIRELRLVARRAARRGVGVWRWYSAQANRLNFRLEYRRSPGSVLDRSGASSTASPGNSTDEDRRRAIAMPESPGRLVFPKLFRRLTVWATGRRATIVPADFTFREHLVSSPDPCFETSAYLRAAAPPHRHLHDFVASAGTVLFDPCDLVFEAQKA